MATSSSINFTTTRDELIKDAFKKINVLGTYEALADEDLQLAARQLNRMIKAWQIDGIYVWTQREAIIFLRDDVQSYTLGSGSTGDHASELTNVVKTTLSAAEAKDQTVLSMTATTGMAVSDNIGIELDDVTRQWTTISALTSTTVTVATALTGDAASGNTVYTYRTKLNRPLRIVNARLEDENGDDRPVTIFSRQEYFDLVQKDNSSNVSYIYYDAGLTSTGTIYVWPTSDNVKKKLRITYARTLEDFDAAADNPDLPVEWYDAIVYNLAVRISHDFRVRSEDIKDVTGMAGYLYTQLKASAQEPEPIVFQPDFS